MDWKYGFQNSIAEFADANPVEGLDGNTFRLAFANMRQVCVDSLHGLTYTYVLHQFAFLRSSFRYAIFTKTSM